MAEDAGDVFDEPSDSLKAFRHFLFKVKGLPVDGKAAATADYIDGISSNGLFSAYFAFGILMFQSHAVNPVVANKIKKVYKELESQDGFSKESKASLTSIFNLIFTDSRTSDVETVLRNGTKIDAKFVKRLATGKIEQDTLMSFSAYMKELGLAKDWRRQIQSNIDDPTNLTHSHIKDFTEKIAKSRLPFYNDELMTSSKRAKKFAANHFSNDSEDWLVHWCAKPAEENMAFFRKLNQSGANFTNSPGDDVTHLVLDRSVDMASLANADKYSLDCDFIFL